LDHRPSASRGSCCRGDADDARRSPQIPSDPVGSRQIGVTKPDVELPDEPEPAEELVPEPMSGQLCVVELPDVEVLADELLDVEVLAVVFAEPLWAAVVPVVVPVAPATSTPRPRLSPAAPAMAPTTTRGRFIFMAVASFAFHVLACIGKRYAFDESVGSPSGHTTTATVKALAIRARPASARNRVRSA
jgi:hypothetical protein